MKKKYPLLGRLALLSTALIWGTSFVIMKGTLESIGTMWVLATRFVISSVLLLIAAGKKLRGVSRRCLRGSILLGVFLAAAYIVQTYGLYYTTPGKNAFLTAVYCVLTPFMAWAVYRRRPKLNNVLAAVLCLTGIGLVTLDRGITEINIGDILTLCCGVFYAAQIVTMEDYSDSGDAACITAIEFSVAALICLAGALMFEPVPVSAPAEAWWSVVYLAVMCTAVCFYLQAWGMKYTPSSTSAMIMTLEAVFGVLTSVLFYGERVTPKLALGFALIFLAMVCSETDFKRLGKERAA